MRVMLAFFLVLLFSLGIVILGLSLASRKQPELGLINGQLRNCPASPNCVCSESSNSQSVISPLVYSIAHADAWQGIKQAIVDAGGEIVSSEGDYLHARFVTALWRFVDDVELRHDETQQLIHIRSASRVGYSDLGKNRQRVEAIRQAFNP